MSTSAPRIFRSSSGSGRVPRRTPARRVAVWRSDRVTSTPRPSTIASRVRTSSMSGRLRSVTGSEVSSAAATVGKAAFLFPPGRTLPLVRVRPSITNSATG